MPYRVAEVKYILYIVQVPLAYIAIIICSKPADQIRSKLLMIIVGKSYANWFEGKIRQHMERERSWTPAEVTHNASRNGTVSQ